MSDSAQSPPNPPETPQKPDLAVRSLGLARFFVILGVISSVGLAISLYLATVLRAIGGVFAAYTDERLDLTKTLLLLAVEQADGLLVATALLITGFGLYSLFIGRPDTLPKWLQIKSIDELKQKLIGVVVAALAVNFFSTAYEGKNPEELVALGVGSALMVAALGYFLKSQHD